MVFKKGLHFRINVSLYYHYYYKSCSFAALRSVGSHQGSVDFVVGSFLHHSLSFLECVFLSIDKRCGKRCLVKKQIVGSHFLTLAVIQRILL